MHDFRCHQRVYEAEFKQASCVYHGCCVREATASVAQREVTQHPAIQSNASTAQDCLVVELLRDHAQQRAVASMNGFELAKYRFTLSFKRVFVFFSLGRWHGRTPM